MAFDGGVAAAEMPRERMMVHGGLVLSDAELVAALLGSGTRGHSAMDLARELVDRYGDLSSLARAEVAELAQFRGLGPAKACALAAALEIGRRAQSPRVDRLAVRCSNDIFRYYASRIAHLNREVFHVMCLDARHRVLQDARIVEGGLTTCSVLPREVYAPAMRCGAIAVVFVHNHPSGDPHPSADDLALTARLKQAGHVLGIRPLDHIIIGDGRYVSLVDDGQFGAR